MLRNALVPLLALATALLVAPATGCGGGGSGSGGGLGGSLQVTAISSTPASGATNVPVSTSVIRVAMSHDIDTSSLAGNVVVEEGGGVVPRTIQGAVSFNGATREIVWQLTPGQSLNATFPSENILEFDRTYRITLTQGIRSTGGLVLIGGFQATFLSAATRFTIVASGTDPLDGASGVLIDPYRVVVNGQVVFATLKVKLDIPLSANSVSGSQGGEPNVNVRVGGPSGAIVPGGVGYDVASGTIFWIPQPGHNPGFPAEPLLKTATSYALTITTRVQDANGNSPSTPLVIDFSTISCAIRLPAELATGQTVIDLQLNEVFAAPNPSTITSDSNGDGVSSSVSDEFVEIVNVSTDYLDLRPFIVKDAAGANPAAFDFTTLTAGSQHQALIPPGRCLVVWNGLEAGQTPSNAVITIPHTKVFFGGLNGNQNSLYNNSGVDTSRITMKVPPASSSGDVMRVDFTNTASGASTGSMTRDPDLTGPITTNHSTLQGGALGRFSPGRKNSGALFP
jgi:hypothetical protein